MPESEKKHDGSDTTGDTSSAIDDVVKQYVDMAQVALADYSGLVRRAGLRLSGDTSPEAGSWADDTAKYWGYWARDHMGLFKMMTDVMGAAMKPAAPPKKP